MNELDKEILLFKKVNGNNKEVLSEHQNFINNNSKQSALYNQGIGRAKLRKFILEKNIDIDFWEKF